jgi:hypothetical protein
MVHRKVFVVMDSYRDGIFKFLRSQGIDSASLCSLAGRYDNPIPTRFLAPIDYSKFPAQCRELKSRYGGGIDCRNRVWN